MDVIEAARYPGGAPLSGEPSRPFGTVVERTRVLQRFDAAQDTPVTVVCAPAGYGKSTVVASWLRCQQPADQETAWIHLTAAHNEPLQIWSDIVGALARSVTSSAASANLLALAELTQRAPAEVPAQLARWLGDQPGVTFLVLDDAQTVTAEEVHSQLVELIAAAPQRLRPFLITRHDPPWPQHRMRLDGLLRDIRGDVLAFDLDEAAAMFELTDIRLPADQVRHLVERTQGWAAGLRLAALGASTAEDPVAFAEDVSGRDEYIADYLLREVYEGLSASWRDLLTRAAVVDEICGELAVALGCGSDSEDRLRELVRHNAFIQPAQDRPGWYRLHPLLLDFLRSQFATVSAERELHRRAAEWFVGQDEPLTALQHARLGRHWDLAGELLGRHLVSWCVCRSPEPLLRWYQGVPREVVLSDAGLATGLAGTLAMLGQPRDIPELVQAAQGCLERMSDPPARFQVLLEIIGLGAWRWSGNLDALLVRARALPTDPVELARLGLSDWLTLRMQVINNIGAGEVWTGEFESALANLTEAARVDGNRPLAIPTLNAQAHLAYLHWIDGDLQAAERRAREALGGFHQLGVPHAVQARCAYLAMAGVEIDRGEPANAARWLEFSGDNAGEPHTAFAAELMRARLLAARGLTFEALAAVRRARDEATDAPFPAALKDHAVLLEAQLLAASGNPVGAQAVAATRLIPSGSDQLRRNTRSKVGRLLAQARREQASEQESAGVAALESALVLAAPEQLRQPFLSASSWLRPLLATRIEQGTEALDFAVELLARLSGGGSGNRAQSRALLVPLTARETNVLRYLASTLTTKEIAQKLYVSVNTVKTHQRAIYQKLGASDRRAAVAHGRELGLI